MNKLLKAILKAIIAVLCIAGSVSTAKALPLTFDVALDANGNTFAQAGAGGSVSGASPQNTGSTPNSTCD